MRRILFPLLGLLLAANVFAQELSSLRIMTWNARFLFDTLDDPDVEIDQEQIPENYEEKLQKTAAVILRNQPHVLALQEVENRAVLEDLVAKLQKPYVIEHFESLDTFTGQDVALLYDPEVLEAAGLSESGLDLATGYEVSSHGEIIVNLPKRGLSKGLLTVPLIWKQTGEALTFLVAHLKSQIGGADSDFKRLTQARTIRQRMEELDKPGVSLVLMGDLNDVPNSMILEEISGESRYAYGYEPENIILYRDLFADASIPDNYTHLVSKWLKAGGKFRFLGSYKTRLDYIITSPWIAYRFANLKVDTRVDLINRDPSDHRPLIAELFPKGSQPQEEAPQMMTLPFHPSEASEIEIRR